MNRLGGDEARFHSERVDRNRLPATRNEKRLHDAARDVVAGDVVESVEVEMPAQLAIDSAQEILVERRSEAGRVVVRQLEHLRRFLQIGPEQERVARLE